jgi:hypothetical protein
MATQTYDFPHSQNSNVITRVILTDISPGVLNYAIFLIRLNNSVASFNNNGASPGGASIDNITIFGQSVPYRTYTFDWWYTTTQTVRRTRNSPTLRDVPNEGLFRVGMTRQIGLGIPTNAAINFVGDTTVGMTVVATSSGTNSVTFSRPQPAASVLIATENINVTPGTVGGIGGVNNARGSVGSATLSGSFTSYIDAPAWSTTSPLPGGTRGVAYSTTVSADRAASYSLANGTTLPSGLSLSSSGVISGTPDTVQSKSFTIRATNSNSSVDRDFTINIVVPSPVFSTTSPLSVAIRGSSYSTTISASDTPSTGYSLVGGILPLGLNLGSNGVLSGNPTTLGTSSFTVRASNTTGSADRTFSLTVNPPAPVFSDQSVIDRAARNIPYQSEVLASDAGYGISTPAYSIFSGSLPPGLTLNSSTGVIGSTTAPTQAATVVGSYQFVIRARNVTGSTNTPTLLIVVSNNLGQRRTDTGFQNITSVRRFDGTSWTATTIAKRFNGTAWVDITNS